MNTQTPVSEINSVHKTALIFQLSAPLLFTNEDIPEAMFSFSDNNVLTNFLGTLEFTKHSGVRDAHSDVGKLKSVAYVPAANLAFQICVPPWIGSWWSLYLSKELLSTTGRALMKIENIFYSVIYVLTKYVVDTEALFSNTG